MSKRSPRTKFKTKRELTSAEFLTQKVQEIRDRFFGSMHVTIVCRHPTDRSGEIVWSDDHIDQVIGTLIRRRKEVDAARDQIQEPGL